ncbi:MAG: hypothetical protein ACK521_06105 [bacterium]
MLNLSKNSKSPFKCQGDYCNLALRTLIPKHLAPIIGNVVTSEMPKVNINIILLERINIRDQYRPLDLSRADF